MMQFLLLKIKVACKKNCRFVLYFLPFGNCSLYSVLGIFPLLNHLFLMSSFVTYCGAWEADGAIFDTRFTLHLHVSQQNDHPCLDICGFVADGFCSPSKVIVLIDCVETLGVSKEEQSVFTRIRIEELL